MSQDKVAESTIVPVVSNYDTLFEF